MKGRTTRSRGEGGMIVNNKKHLLNFGRNLELSPSAYDELQNEGEVLAILDQYGLLNELNKT